MKFNNDPSFVGIEKFRLAHDLQISEFEEWALKDEWEFFHQAHYDWWVFPVDQKSSKGYMWTVYDGEVAKLKQDKIFISKYLRGFQLVSAAWGWDIDNRTYIKNPKIDQKWHDFPIRLFKAAQSANLFSFSEFFESLKIYALILINQGKPFIYNEKDLSWLFTTGINPET